MPNDHSTPRAQQAPAPEPPAAGEEDGLAAHLPRGPRLAALRALLAERGLDGFIVPHADEHQNEYLPRRAERLAWLTGFTGSAGAAVVTADQAALFVDGRYTLQARQEVDGEAFTFCHLSDCPPSQWIAETVAAGARIGYDPWLHTQAEVARLKSACKRAGAELAAVDGNPIDALWKNQPPAPTAPVVPHPIRFAGCSAAEKRTALARDLEKQRAGAAVITDPASIAWLFNLRGGDVPFTPLPLGMAVLRADASATLFMDDRKLGPATREALGEDVILAAPEALGTALDSLGRNGESVVVDQTGTPSWIVERLSTAKATVVPGEDPCARPRAIKNAVELEGMRNAHRRDGAALTRFLCWLARTAANGDITEMSAADRLEELRSRNEHFKGLSFPTISAAAEHGAIVHYRVSAESDRPLRPGELYLVDSGAQYLDGTTDVTRTVVIGEPTPDMRRHFTLVLKGHIALARCRFPAGTFGPQLDVLARHALWQAGLDYDHGTGHGVGSFLGVHEGPQRISKMPGRVALEAGMILSNEPGYYKEGAYGIRIENLVAVVDRETPDGGERPMLGFETLTQAPIERALIDPKLLDDEERAWLDAYHARIRDSLAPLVDRETEAWLREATAPIA